MSNGLNVTIGVAFRERRPLMNMQTYNKFCSLTDAEFGLMVALIVMTLLLALRYAW